MITFFRRKSKKGQGNDTPTKPPAATEKEGNSACGLTPCPAFLDFDKRTDVRKYGLVDTPEPLLTLKKSKLSKTLNDVLQDADATEHFVHFMESRNAQNYVLFWLDAESFRASALTRQHSLTRLAGVGSKSFENVETSDTTIISEMSPSPSVQFSHKDSLVNSSQSSHTEDSRQLTMKSSHGYVSGDRTGAKTTNEQLPSTSLTAEMSSTGCTAPPLVTDSSNTAGVCKDSPQDMAPSLTVVTNTDTADQSQTSLLCDPVHGQSKLHSSQVTGSDQSLTVLSTSESTGSNPVTTQSVVRNSASSQSAVTNPVSSQSAATNPVSSQLKANNSTSSQSKGSVCSGSSPYDAANSRYGNTAHGDSGLTSGPECSTPTASALHAHGGSVLVRQKSLVLTAANMVNPAERPTTGMSQCVSVQTGSEQIQSTMASKQEPTAKKIRSSISTDAVRIFGKYIAKEAACPIGVTEELRARAISTICGEDGRVDPDCFVTCQQFAFNVMNQRFHSDFLESDFHCRHQVNILTGRSLQLEDILYNDNALLYFTEFMDQEGVLALLQCWTDIVNYEEVSLDEPLQQDAMVLYDKYFSLQAITPLGFTDDVRLEVESNICLEEGPPLDCFSRPKSIVLATLRKVYLSQFLQSDVYFRFLSDLISSSAQRQRSPHVRRRPSDSGSLHSNHSNTTAVQGTRNTLLASESRLKKVLQDSADDMSMDEAMFNPDTLWQRPQQSISIGKIDSLGRFVSDLEPEPEESRKKKGLFFWRQTDDESQQEMAAQIAKMIISDITTVTSGGKNSHMTPDRPPTY